MANIQVILQENNNPAGEVGVIMRIYGPSSSSENLEPPARYPPPAPATHPLSAPPAGHPPYFPAPAPATLPFSPHGAYSPYAHPYPPTLPPSNWHLPPNQYPPAHPPYLLPPPSNQAPAALSFSPYGAYSPYAHPYPPTPPLCNWHLPPNPCPLAYSPYLHPPHTTTPPSNHASDSIPQFILSAAALANIGSTLAQLLGS